MEISYPRPLNYFPGRTGYPGGCVSWWEVILLEITDNTAHREDDASAGFKVLEP